MAKRLNTIDVLGTALGLSVVLFAVLPLMAVGFTGGTTGNMTPALWRAVTFTLMQTGLSTVFTLVCAIPLARALWRTQFVGRQVFILFLSVPFVMPVVVAILGIMLAFGNSGLLNQSLRWLGFEGYSLYGLHGIVVAHVFFNIPLATRMLLLGWSSIPEEHIHLVASVRGSGFRLIEWPMLRSRLPAISTLVAMLCLTSFAIALILGGGPWATTIEVAIYQSIRYQFDLGQAAMLAVIQTAFGFSILFVAYRYIVNPQSWNSLRNATHHWLLPKTLWQRWLDALILLAGAVFVGLPIILIMTEGVMHFDKLPSDIWPAATRTILVAISAATISVTIGTIIVCSKTKLIALVTVLPLTLSQIVLGTGIFILVRGIVSPISISLFVVVPMLAFLGLPFVIQVLSTRFAAVQADYSRLSQSIRLTGFNYVRVVVIPLLTRDIAYVFGLVAALSAGDLGAIALFGTPEDATLPLLLYQLLGSYQFAAASAVAFVLAIVSVGMFLIFERIGARYAQA